MSTNQASNQNNVNNLEVLINKITNFKTGYNPTRAEFSTENLSQLKTRAQTSIDAVTDAEIVLQSAASARTEVFRGFDPFITRVINAIRISGASPQSITQAESIVRELHGKRASAIATDAEIAEAKEKGVEINQITRHINTIQSKLTNFNILIKYLETLSAYKPNETDLTVASLTTRYTTMKETNEQYIAAEAKAYAARSARDKILYAEGTGLVDIAQGVKTYVKSAFGATSDEYLSISGITFTKR